MIFGEYDRNMTHPELNVRVLSWSEPPPRRFRNFDPFRAHPCSKGVKIASVSPYGIPWQARLLEEAQNTIQGG